MCATSSSTPTGSIPSKVQRWRRAYIAAPESNASILNRASEILAREDIDFIFADSEKAGLYALLLARRFGLPYVYNTHNVEFRRYLSMAGSSWLRYLFVPYLYILEKLASRNAALTVAISESDARVFQAWVDTTNLLIAPCAFDENALNPFHNPAASTRTVILMVGNFAYGANREGAYSVCREVVPPVVADRPDVVFRFVGRGFPQDIEHPNVEAPGFVEDLLPEYSNATMVIAPIEMGGGIKIKVIEALASGKLLVTTEKGMEGIDYSILKNVRVVARNEFATEIIRALREGVSTTIANWDFISSRFGTREALSGLMIRIDQILAT